MTDSKSILLVGVGGQGTILASKLLTLGLLDKGYDVKMSEIHGMSQRGGAVSSQVRYALPPARVASPVIEPGAADMLVSFELMEALRWLNYLRPGGRLVVNDYRIPPMPVITGQAAYPEHILEELRRAAPVIAVDAAGIATALGNSRIMNMVLLGCIISAMGLTDIDWQRILRANVKPAFVDLNLSALAAGIQAAGA